MITYDKIDIFTVGIFYFLNGFDATIKGNDQGIVILCSVINSFKRYSVSLPVSVRNIIPEIIIPLFKKRIN